MSQRENIKRFRPREQSSRSKFSEDRKFVRCRVNVVSVFIYVVFKQSQGFWKTLGGTLLLWRQKVLTVSFKASILGVNCVKFPHLKQSYPLRRLNLLYCSFYLQFALIKTRLLIFSDTQANNNLGWRSLLSLTTWPEERRGLGTINARLLICLSFDPSSVLGKKGTCLCSNTNRKSWYSVDKMSVKYTYIFTLFCVLLPVVIPPDLVTVFDAILTSRQTREKLQCLYENLMSNNFRRTAVLKKYQL